MLTAWYVFSSLTSLEIIYCGKISDTFLLLFQVGTGKVTAAWIGMMMFGTVDGQYV